MRTLPVGLIEANITRQRKPRIAIKIFNEQGNFWFTTHNDIIPGDGLPVLKGIKASTASTQNVTPEKGFSTIGGMSFSFQDKNRILTDKLRSIDSANDSIFNNKAEVWFGLEGLDFSDYGKLFTFIVDDIQNDSTDYDIKLSDRQREQRKNIFPKTSTELVGVVEGGNLVELTSSTVLDGTGIIEVLDASNFKLVEHDSDWDVDPNSTIGYFEIPGITTAGLDIKEVFSFTGFDGGNPNRLTGVKRSRFNTATVGAKGTAQDGSAEVIPFVYIDLNVPKMIYSLLTGKLIGQSGTIPDEWNAGVDELDVDLPSFLNIGDDLWNLPFSFQGESSQNAKDFIAQQIMRATNLFLKIDQDGRFELKRFASVPQNSPPVYVFSEPEVLSINKIKRDVKSVRNRFVIQWEWRSDLEKFVRTNPFIDNISSAYVNKKTDALILGFRGIRNRSRDILNSLQSLAEGIRARSSNPSIPLSITVPISAALSLEVGDLVGVDLKNWPDYANADNLASTFEIQSVSFNLVNQTADLQLFGTTGVPQPINFGQGGSNVVTINHTGWKELSAALTSAGIPYTVSSGTLTITGSGTLIGGDTTAVSERYYYDGNVIGQPGITLTVTKNFVLDATDINLSGVTFDASGNGLAGGTGAATGTPFTTPTKPQNDVGLKGYFGGADLADEAPYYKLRTGASERLKRQPPTKALVPASASQIDSFNIRVDGNGNLIGLPATLLGNSGSAGEPGVIESNSGAISYVRSGSGGNSGGGVIFICENLFTNSETVIDTSGADGQIGDKAFGASSENPYGGAGGGGYPGCLLVLLKTKQSPLPILTGRHFAKIGGIFNEPNYSYRAPQSGWFNIPETPSEDTLGPYRSPLQLNSRGLDVSSSARLVKYITSDTVTPPQPGVDKIPLAALPTDILIDPRINEPLQQTGNVVTIFVQAVPPADPNYAESFFEFRTAGEGQWAPAGYLTGNQASFQRAADGTEYEISARSVNIEGVTSTARKIVNFTVPTVNRDSNDSEGGQDGADPNITLPKIRGFELVNRITDDDFDKFKSPNAEFRWIKMSNTLGGNVTQINGATDLHLEGYKVRVSKTDGTLLREEIVKDSFFVYTYDKNKKDNDGSPIRQFRVEVQGIATTGHVGEFVGFEVENPAPDAPSNVIVSTGTNSFNVTFDLPVDVDFVGVDFFVIQSPNDPLTATPIRIANNSVTAEGLPQSTTFNFVLRSVDQFGTGGQTDSIGVTTNTLQATDVSGIGPWATRTNPVDLAFIQANAAADSIPSEKIVNLTAAKITAGQVTVQVDIGTGILLDGGTGLIQSINSGFITTIGPHLISSNEYIISAYDGLNVVFGVKSSGEATMNFITGLAALAIGSATFGLTGCQIENNSGNPRLHIGGATEDTSMTFEDSTFTVGDNVGLKGMDGYENGDYLFYHLYGHQLLGAVIRDSGSMSITTSFGQLATTLAGASQTSTAYMQLRDGGNAANMAEDFSWKVYISIRSWLDTSQNGLIKIGVGSSSIASEVGTWFEFERLDASNFRFRTQIKRANAISPNISAWVTVPEDSFYVLELVKKDNLTSSYVTDTGTGTVYGMFAAFPGSYENKTIRNALLLDIATSPTETDEIGINIYNYKLKGVRL